MFSAQWQYPDAIQVLIWSIYSFIEKIIYWLEEKTIL